MSKRNRSSNMFLGGLLIGAGILFMFNTIFPGLFGGLVWSAAFVAGGLALYGVYLKNRLQWWLLIPAYSMVAVASYILLGSIQFVGNVKLFPGEFIGSWVMFTIGFPFLYVYLRNRQHWWALIPAYAMAAIGGLITATLIIDGLQVAAYVMFSIALPFMYVYFRNREYWWALIPGGITGAMGVAFMIAGFAYLIPAAMILAGVYLLVRQAAGGRKPAEKRERVEVEVPRYGPEADRPGVEFEPIGRNEPEVEKMGE